MTENENGMPQQEEQQQAAPQQAVGEPMATPQQVMAAKRMLKKVRKEIAKFHEIRRRNNEVAAGLRPGAVSPEDARMLLATNRDAQREREAVDRLRQLISIIYGRTPTKEEMQVGVPEGFETGLGIAMAIPAVVAIGLAAAGASVYSVFAYLRAREETIQHQTATPMERMLNAASNNIWAIAAAGAVGLGALMYFKGKEVGEQKPVRELQSLAKRLGTKSFEENPGEVIKGWMEKLSGDEKQKLASFLVDGEEEEPEEDEEPEEEEIEEEEHEESEESEDSEED